MPDAPNPPAGRGAGGLGFGVIGTVGSSWARGSGGLGRAVGGDLVLEGDGERLADVGHRVDGQLGEHGLGDVVEVGLVARPG